MRETRDSEALVKCGPQFSSDSCADLLQRARMRPLSASPLGHSHGSFNKHNITERPDAGSKKRDGPH